MRTIHLTCRNCGQQANVEVLLPPKNSVTHEFLVARHLSSLREQKHPFAGVISHAQAPRVRQFGHRGLR